jgi:hypothetical protein
MDYKNVETIIAELEKSTQPYATYHAFILKTSSAEQQGQYKEAVSLYDQAGARAGEPNALTGLGRQR